MGGTTRRVTGPMEPMTTDQKYAGLSRAAQRQYLRGAAQKRGEVDMVAAGGGVSREGLWKGGFLWCCLLDVQRRVRVGLCRKLSDRKSVV